MTLSISESARRWITLLFALGTPFWYLASLGTYWFTAHVVVVLFTLLATREALTKQRWFLVGLWLACAGFARPTALFLAPFFLIIMFYAPRITRHASRFASYVLRHCRCLRWRLPSALAPISLTTTPASNPSPISAMPTSQARQTSRVCMRATADSIRGLCRAIWPYRSFHRQKSMAQCRRSSHKSCAYLLEGVNLSDTSALITPNPLGMSIFFVTPALLIDLSPACGDRIRA